MHPDVVRIALPAAAPPAPRASFPFVQALAPLVLAVVLWLVTGSLFALVVALLGPVLVIASTVEGRRSARRARLDDRERLVRRLEAVGEEVEGALARRRAEAEAVLPELAAVCAGGQPPGAPLRIGRGDVPSGIALAGDADALAEDAALAEAVARLRERAAVAVDVPVGAGPGELAVDAPPPVRAAIARGLVLAAAAAQPPGARVVVPECESWAAALPHRVEHADRWEVHAPGAEHAAGRPAAAVLRVLAAHDPLVGRVPLIRVPATGEPSHALLGHPVERFRPALVSAAEARLRARAIAERARSAGWRDPGLVPERVGLAGLLDEGARTAADRGRAGLAAPIGRDADGAVEVDLVRDGPHALVAGTTGSGKSELLISWVLSLAHRHPPEELALLLVDFKGGSAFAPLEALPHVVGTVSDLDAAAAMRAVTSLSAELRRREHVLAGHGARDIEALPPGVLPRLVVVVDELAALLALDPGIGSVLADLAARGRSLGLHLVLCTQRPAGIVRDAVLANITLRMCLRVLDAADAEAVVGTRAPADLPPSARGRLVLADGGPGRELQAALADAADAERVAARWAGHPRPAARPWLEPLPAVLPAERLPAPSNPGALVVGVVDLPEEQAQRPLELDPWSDGAPLVVGGTASGRTTALRMLAHAAAPRAEVRWASPEPADLWAALATPPAAGRALVLVDDLDRVLSGLDPEAQGDLVELIRCTARDARRTGLAVAASTRTAGGPVHALQTAFEHRLVLRLPSREEHVLAGAELAGFRAARRAGSLVWRGAEAQLAQPPGQGSAVWLPEVPVVDLAAGEWAVAAPRTRELLARLHAAGIDAGAPGSGARVAVADPESWLSAFAELAAVRRDGRLLLIACSGADHRTLTRLRGPLPPLSAGDAWLVEAGETRRVRPGVRAARANEQVETESVVKKD